MTAENSGLDALMAAITDEPLTDEAREDPAFLAEHRSAEADVALLREQLALIGDALAEPPPEETPKPVAVRPSPARRRARTFGLVALAAVVAAGVLSGLSWLLTLAGNGMGDASGSDSAADSDAGSAKEAPASAVPFGSPRYLACARTVAEGEVTAVERLPETEEFRVTVHVTRYYLPKEGDDELIYVVSRYDVPRLSKGDHVLFGVRQGSTVPDHWVVGEKNVARERAWVAASLAESRKLGCE